MLHECVTFKVCGTSIETACSVAPPFISPVHIVYGSYLQLPAFTSVLACLSIYFYICISFLCFPPCFPLSSPLTFIYSAHPLFFFCLPGFPQRFTSLIFPPAFRSAPVIPSLPSTVARYCGYCEERCSDSEMCQPAES